MLSLDIPDIASRVPGAVVIPKGEGVQDCDVLRVPVTEAVDVALFGDGTVLLRGRDLAGTVTVYEGRQLCSRAMASWFAAERLAEFVAWAKQLIQ